MEDTLSDLRRHVLDDAVELLETLGVVEPLATSANVVSPGHLLLRRLLTRHVLLVLTRLHARKGKGPSGLTASIDGVLEAAQVSQLSRAQVDSFGNRREALKAETEREGVWFEDIHFFRTTELAHSIHAPGSMRAKLPWNVIYPFATGTYDLVREIESALVSAGAPVICDLPPSTTKCDEWAANGRDLWRI